jgi:hypothetical protein
MLSNILIYIFFLVFAILFLFVDNFFIELFWSHDLKRTKKCNLDIFHVQIMNFTC